MRRFIHANKVTGLILSFVLLLATSGGALMAQDAPYRHHSKAKGALVGGAAGAVVGGKKGAVIGAGAGALIQHHRNKKARRHSHR